MKVNVILYVQNQSRSRDFYEKILHSSPVLDVPGMTEFCLGSNLTIGLMPNKGIRKLLGNKITDPDDFTQVSKAELYLFTDNPEAELVNAVNAGAVEISQVSERDWGHIAGYCRDFDGHIIAFAKEK